MIETIKNFYEANQKPIMAVLAVIALFLIYDNFMRSDSSSAEAAPAEAAPAEAAPAEAAPAEAAPASAPVPKHAHPKANKKKAVTAEEAADAAASVLVAAAAPVFSARDAPVSVDTFANKKDSRKRHANKKPVAKKENFVNKKASAKKIPEGAPAEFFHFK